MVRVPMTLDMVNTVWSVMHEDELYSPSDLANMLGQPFHAIARVLEFLEKYGFVEQVTKRELIFKRLESEVSPGDTLKVLQTLLADAGARDEGRIANVSEAPKRFGALQ